MLGEAGHAPTDVFAHLRYLVGGRVLGVFGELRVCDAAGEPMLFGRLRRERVGYTISLFREKRGRGEVLTVRPRQNSHMLEVVDATTGRNVGALKRKKWIPFARDQWTFFDREDTEIGFLREQSAALASLNRYVPHFVPKKFHGEVDGRPVCTLRQRFNPFVMKMDLDFTEDFSGSLDRRLGIAAAVLVCAFGPKG